MNLAETRKAFTLAELVVALGITSTVMIGTVAAIGIGGRTFQVATAGIGSSEANDGLARMSADIEQAIHFDERTATAIAFYVPDRTGDGTPDHLRYAWSGTPGDSITLSLNGSDAAPVIEDVETVSFEYVYASVAGEAAWASADVEYLLVDDPYVSHSAFVTLTRDVAVAMIVEPVPPSGVAAYAISRVSVPLLDGHNGNHDIEVTIHRVNMTRGTPESDVLASATISGHDVPEAYGMVEAVFSAPASFRAGDFVAVVVQSDTPQDAAYVPLAPSPDFLTDGWIATSSVPGTWALNATLDMPLVLYATEVE